MVNRTKFARTTRSLAPAAALALVFATLGVTLPAAAQTATATLDVVATDGTGAPLPGATVEVKRPSTGLSRAGVTGTSGLASFAALPPGAYDVAVKLAGFETVEQKSVVLLVGQSARVNATLQGKRTESISVVATAPLVDVYKTDSSTNITPEQIRDLPTPDRDFQRLAFVAPGVERERGAFRFVSGGPVIGGGGNASQSTILVDGVDFTDPALGLAKTKFSQDAISEFRVIQNRFDAEVGGSSGGALSILTKTGTNTFAGSLFGFYRGDALRAKGALEQDSSISYERDQFGFTLGGPIVKDQTHFFASFEQINSTTPILFRPQGAFKSLAEDVKHPFHQTLAYGGLDQVLSDSDQLTAKIEYERYRENNFRVGGVADVTNGQELNRDNLNVTVGDTAVFGSNTVNELRAQFGKRKYDEPPNSTMPTLWYTGGATLQTGGSLYGDLLGDGNQWEVRDTLNLHFGGKTGTHDVKVGAAFQRVVDRSVIDVYSPGLFYYLTDTKALLFAYLYGVGSADVKANTNRIAAFVQDDWRPITNLSISLGVRYDLDTNGNNPDFQQPVLGIDGRKVDSTNIQPRLGFSYDIDGKGAFVARGGVGLFTGRYLMVPLFTELQQNGITGRVTYTNANGALLGFPQFTLDPNNPQNTGIRSKPAIGLLAPELKAPQSTQATLGLTSKLGATGLFFDVEGVYTKGRDEIAVRDVNWSGNATHTRPITAYDQVNEYTNDGRSEYKALVFALNGNLRGGHVVSASVTFASKHNINDDFSPEFPTGYPSDPANMDAEYGRARSYERMRIVVSGVARLPWQFSVAPVFEYGTGQPWTRRLGYDYNGDGKTGDRLPGVDRFGQDGPRYSSLNLRISKAFNFSGFGFEILAEAFNLLNTVNYDVTSIDNAEFTAGPTVTNPAAAYKPNPNYGNYSATLPSREFQLGVKVTF
jgi:TonB dependent receptor/Carboxypeptidase regulatory-like domain